MQELGNFITLLGIAVTLVAYFGQHGTARLRELEPGLVAWWNRRRGWVMRKLGRSKSVNIQGVAATATAGVSMTATGMVWSPPQPDDELAVRTDKLERNLEALRANVEELRAQDQKQLRELTDGLSRQLTALGSEMASWREASQLESTWAMRWEVRGLLIALVGAGISLLG